MRLDDINEGVAGPEKCWPGYRKVGTKPGTGKNAGKRVNDCEKIKEDVDVVDQGEYDREGDMAIGQLNTIEDAAAELRSILDAEDNLPEWVQSKITKAVDYIDTARDYMKSKDGVTEVSKSTLDRYVSKAVDAHGHADFAARQSKNDPTLRSYHVDQKKTAEKRRQGISRALDRMSKEGVAEGEQAPISRGRRAGKAGKPLAPPYAKDSAEYKEFEKGWNEKENIRKANKLAPYNKQGVAEGAGNIGSAIKSLYQKIYAAGDDEVEFFYNDSPIFAQYWDEYEGDIDSIIAGVDPKELQIMHDELESYVEGAGLAESGPFSYGAKKSRRGSVADLAAKKRREQEKNRPPTEPKDQMVGTAKVTKGVAEGATPASTSKVLRLIQRHHSDWFDNYGMGEVEDTVVDMAELGKFQGMSAVDALALVGQELESLYGQRDVAEERNSALSRAVREAGWGRRYSSYHDELSSRERAEQDYMDQSKRDFKRAEMQHELGHEDDPNFERNLRQQQIDKDRGPWYIRIDGKVYKQKGVSKSFDWKRGANNYALAMIKNNPSLQGRVLLTKSAEDK